MVEHQDSQLETSCQHDLQCDIELIDLEGACLPLGANSLSNLQVKDVRVLKVNSMLRAS